MNDLFSALPPSPRKPAADKLGADKPVAGKPPAAKATGGEADYSARDIEVLEGLEPVRRHPGMYIGGTDDAALHHLAAEILDNAMDEAVAGFATVIDVTLAADGALGVRDNGRGIPVDPHPKFKHKSALEVILTTLHSGGKFRVGAYATSGGLHGVGSSVVNALSARFSVEVAREKRLWRQDYVRGKPVAPLQDLGAIANRRGTSITFLPDPEIFGTLRFSASRLFKLCRSKAFLFQGVRLRWACPDSLATDEVPASAELHFPGGLADSLAEDTEGAARVTAQPFQGQAELPRDAKGAPQGRLEWAVTWLEKGSGFLHSFCNTIPTPQGGTHEAGLRNALTRGLRAWGEKTANKRAAAITAEDVLAPLAGLVSVFLREPQFQGQTKEKLTNTDAARLVEAALRDPFDHYLGDHPREADNLLTYVIERAEERIRRRDARDTPRKSATRKLRLPGKLADCTREDAAATELFLVEGDSAGGTAKQARNRETQAVLPLRGKILNVASASTEKLRQNQELRDLIEALGCGIGERFDITRLRYGRVIIMTDADVDGAHIASLLMTFFYRELPELVRRGHVFLARPPLYRLTQGGTSLYAMDDRDRARKEKHLKGKAKIEVSRFKGLGEMPMAQLRETTMHPASRTLLRVIASPETRAETANLVESLMGKRPELRFAFITEHARDVTELDV